MFNIFTQTPKRSKEIEPLAQLLIRLITGTERLLTLYPVCIINANASNQQMMIGKFNVA